MFLCMLLLGLMFRAGIFLVYHALVNHDLVNHDLVNHDLASIGWMWLVRSTALGIAVYEVPRFQIRRAIKANTSLQGEIALLLNQEGTEFSYATGK